MAWLFKACLKLCGRNLKLPEFGCLYNLLWKLAVTSTETLPAIKVL